MGAGAFRPFPSEFGFLDIDGEHRGGRQQPGILRVPLQGGLAEREGGIEIARLMRQLHTQHRGGGNGAGGRLIEQGQRRALLPQHRPRPREVETDIGMIVIGQEFLERAGRAREIAPAHGNHAAEIRPLETTGQHFAQTLGERRGAIEIAPGDGRLHRFGEQCGV